jgi:hypothetical protein
MKVAICGIAKCENLYLREWVEYYRNMGICNIILYDNNDENGEYPHLVIGDYISSGYVIYKNARGKYRYQIAAYNECYEEYKNTYDWIGFLDIDEYWCFRPDLTLDTLFTEERYPNAFAVFFNWLNYGDNGRVHYENKPIQERFTKPTFPLDFGGINGMANKVKKVFLKCCGDNVKAVFYDANAVDHFYLDEPREYYASNGVTYGEGADDVLDYSVGYIKHYRTLTIEEFLHRRFGRRGYADNASHHNKDKIMSYFWEQNEWTEEKQKVVDDFFSMFEVVDDAPIETKRGLDYE